MPILLLKAEEERSSNQPTKRGLEAPLNCCGRMLPSTGHKLRAIRKSLEEYSPEKMKSKSEAERL